MDIARTHILVCGGTGCSSSNSQALIDELNRELEEKGAITVQGKVSRSYLIERMFDVHEDKDEGKCQ